METSFYKSKIFVHGIKQRPSNNVWMSGKVLGPQTKDGKGNKDQTVAQTSAAVETKPSVFLQKLNSTKKSLVLSILLYRCEKWMLTADLESRIQDF